MSKLNVNVRRLYLEPTLLVVYSFKVKQDRGNVSSSSINLLVALCTFVWFVLFY